MNKDRGTITLGKNN